MTQADETPLTERKVVRRGLIGGLAGLGAGALLELSKAGHAEANNNDNVVIAADNLGQNVTYLRRDGTSDPAMVFLNTNTTFSLATGGDGVQGISNKTTGHAAGVRGQNSGAGVVVGVVGCSEDALGVGVIGRSGPIGSSEPVARSSVGVEGQSSISTGIGTRGVNAGNGTGVYGVSNSAGFVATGNGSGQGVHGKTGTGIGVLGEATTASATGAFGVRGVAAGNGTGVRGVSNTGSDVNALGTGSGTGVQGMSGSGNGVQGISSSGAGLRGNSTSFVGVVGISTGSHGLYGSTSALNGVGFVGENTAGGLAGFFQGNVQVVGNLYVSGAKNAIIKMQDGTTASVYCQESPEPYFEDFGRGQVVAGVASVVLEREFAALVAGNDYMVFLTPQGPSGGLYVNRQTPGGFEVRDPSNGNVPFTYRVVTRRKDIEGRRFARVGDAAAQSVAATRAALGIGSPIAPSPPAPQPFVPAAVPPVQPGPAVQPGPGLTVQLPPADGTRPDSGGQPGR